MDYSALCWDGTTKSNPLKKIATKESFGFSKQEGIAKLEKNTEKIALLQDKLYAEGSKGLLIILQAMDAAGKDGTVKRLTTSINAQGVEVRSFKQPSGEELAHDYLWRVHSAVPPRGKIGIFNRSHYEDILVSRVLDLPKQQNLPASVLKNIWKNRYQQINQFEEYLLQNGITVLKFYLHISPEEQKERFLSRIEDPAKNWKFSKADLSTRENWEKYMQAYKECFANTSTPSAPWYIIPSDKKWVTHMLVSEIVADTLKQMDPRYPTVSKEQKEQLNQIGDFLMSGKETLFSE